VAATSRIDAALGACARILLDSSTLIAFHSPREEAHALATHLLGRIERADDPLTGYFSILSAPELLVRPLRVGPGPYALMHTFLTQFPNLHLLPLDMTVAVQAATLRASTGLKLADAVIVASGQLAACEAIVSNDEAWVKKVAPLFTAFRWVYLGQYL
jgi:predicted nucleic acid-binding protein